MEEERVYMDVGLPIGQRVEDLLSRMTLEEKIHEMSVRSAVDTDSPGNAAKLNNIKQKEYIEKSRLGIPVLLYRESSHGLNTTGTTSFPSALSMASTWDADLLHRIGRVIGSEGRVQGVHQGLSPMLDVSRDPRWGRVEETLGEDASLVGKLGAEFIKGMQGDYSNGIIATPKHFVAYSAPEGGKDNDPIELSERALEETYLPPYKVAVQDAHTISIMACYGAVNGVPCHADKRLLTDKLGEWGFDGFVIGDCPGIAGLVGHKVAADIKEAICLAVNAGLHMQFYDLVGDAGELAGEQEFERILLELVNEGKVPESQIDEAARRILRAKFRLGLFENPYVTPEEADVVCSDSSHRELAREVAVKGTVLLKNDGLLPLKKDIRSIAVIGPNADVVQLGDYSGTPFNPVAPLQGLKNKLPGTEIFYAKGCELKSQAMNVPKFAVRITGDIIIDQDGDYAFQAVAKDGVRYKIDDATVIDTWNPEDFPTNSPDEGPIYLSKGLHSIQLEYYKIRKRLDPTGASRSDDASLRLLWKKASGKFEVIPPYAFRHKAELGFQQNGIGEGLKMEVFSDVGFDKLLPDQTRIIDNVNFNWLDKSPILAMSDDNSVEHKDIAEAVEIAKKADIAIVFLGEASSGPEQLCGEHYDRSELGLPGSQELLIKSIYETGVPTVAGLINGRPLAIPWLVENIPAILEAWYPGQEGGNAIADILLGDTNPSGKLPISVPRSSGQLPVYYNQRPRMGRYIDASSDPLFPFGYGLSYTTFQYSNLTISPNEIAVDGMVSVSIDITNTGDVAGEEVVQLYLTDVVSSVTTPVKQLRGFARIALSPGETERVSFTLTAQDMQLLDCDLKPVVEPGEFRVTVGPNSVEGLTDTFRVLG